MTTTTAQAFLPQQAYDYLSKNGPTTTNDLAAEFGRTNKVINSTFRRWPKVFEVIGKLNRCDIWQVADGAERPPVSPYHATKQPTMAMQPVITETGHKRHGKRTPARKRHEYTPIVTPERHAWRPPQRDRTEVRIVADPQMMSREDFVEACMAGFQNFMLRKRLAEMGMVLAVEAEQAR
jgi:hypothetical protein